MTKHFTSRFAFMMVTAGAAIGLGNIWAFPFVAGQNGGGGFMVVYILALLLVAGPAMMAELVLGRMGQASPPSALAKVKADNNGIGPWSMMGWLGMIASIFVLSFYAVIAGEAAYYGYFALSEGFSSLPSGALSALDNGFKTSFTQPKDWTMYFLIATIAIVSFKITKGLEFAGKYLMPVLLVLIVMLVIYAGYIGDFKAAVNFLFGFEKFSLSSGMIMAAVGQAFFSLSVGICGLMMYGAYMGNDIKLPQAVAMIVSMDFVIAILAGFAIFPLVFSENVAPSAGPGLVFETLPLLFAKLPMGDGLGALFFLLLTIAAITSSIAMMAPMVARFEESGFRRVTGSVIIGAVAFVLSFLTIFSFGPLYDYYPLDMFAATSEMNLFALIREGINNIFLPIGGLAFLLITGWGVKRPALVTAMNINDGQLFNFVYCLIRYVAPIVLIIMITTVWF